MWGNTFVIAFMTTCTKSSIIEVGLNSGFLRLFNTNRHRFLSFIWKRGKH